MFSRVLQNLAYLCLSSLLVLTLLPPETLAQRVRISRADRELVTTKLNQLNSTVTVRLYTGGGNLSKTRQTSALLEFMKQSSDKIQVITNNMDSEPSLKANLGVDHGPVIAIKGDKFQGHSYYGLPSQMELEPFLDGILIAAGQGSRLDQQSISFLSNVDKEVHIRVFVTPD